MQHEYDVEPTEIGNLIVKLVIQEPELRIRLKKAKGCSPEWVIDNGANCRAGAPTLLEALREAEKEWD